MIAAKELVAKRVRNRVYGTPQERFWAKVNKNGRWILDTQCWDWTAATYHDGYGRIGYGKDKVVRAHRLLFEWVNGPIPEGMLLRHRCDNRLCVRPGHLELGTDYDNAHDAIERGRKGDTRKRLTEEIVAGVLDRIKHGLKRQAIVDEFGISMSTYRKIKNGTTWVTLMNQAHYQQDHAYDDDGQPTCSPSNHVSKVGSKTCYCGGSK